jgi:hypothetical protein
LASVSERPASAGQNKRPSATHHDISPNPVPCSTAQAASSSIIATAGFLSQPLSESRPLKFKGSTHTHTLELGTDVHAHAHANCAWMNQNQSPAIHSGYPVPFFSLSAGSVIAHLGYFPAFPPPPNHFSPVPFFLIQTYKHTNNKPRFRC